MAIVQKSLRHATMILAFFVPSLGHAENTEPKKLIALQEYISANSRSLSDPPTFQYVLVQCAAMYHSLSARFNRETAPDRLAVKSLLKRKGDDYLSYSFNPEFKIQSDEESTRIANLQESVINFMKIYEANMNDASTRLGSLWSDEAVKSDYDTCEGLLTSIGSLQK